MQVSIITPCAPKDEGRLEELYASLCAQKGVDWEWLIMYDGFVPEFTKWRDGDHRSDKRVVPLPLDKMGAGPARNVGALHAQHDVLRFIDADDLFLDDESLRSELVALERSGTKAHLRRSIRLSLNGQRRTEVNDLPVGVLPAGTVARELSSKPITQQCVALTVQRTAFLAAGGYAAYPRMEDWLLLCHLNQQTEVYNAGPGEATTLYRETADQTTNNDFPWWFSGKFSQIVAAVVEHG